VVDNGILSHDLIVVATIPSMQPVQPDVRTLLKKGCDVLVLDPLINAVESSSLCGNFALDPKSEQEFTGLIKIAVSVRKTNA
jgi:hypothetical protein